METTVANSSYFDRMEHSSTMGSSGVSRDINFQNPLEGDPDFAAYTMSSNYKQTPMMLSSSSMLGSGEEPFHYEFGERIGAMLGMETMFDGNLNSSVSQGDWWSDLEQISSQSTLGMNLLNAAPQDVFSSGAYNVGSTIPPGVDVIRINQDLEKAPSLNLHLSVPSKNTHLLNASRSCSPTRMRLNKRPRTRPDIIDKKLVCPKRNRNDTKLRNDRRLKERALAILETEFRFNPRPDQQTMQVQARLIGSTFDDISQWFDQMRRQGLQSNLNQDRRGLRPKEPSSRDRISPVRRTRKNSEDHSGLIQIFDSTKSRKERNAAWDTQKKKWQCTTPSCMKPLKNKSEWVRHENTHGQPSEYVCMSRGCSRAVLSSAVPCPSCASTSQRRRRPIASCQCQTSERCRFKRKDKLQEHLRKQHNLMLPPSVVSEWTEQINHDSRSRCGFCGENLENWEMRLSHIAEHFESGWEMSSWNETLTGELSDEEKEEEENGDKDMSDFDEMEEDSDNENGDASLDDSPDAGADNENQDENSGDRGSGDAKDTGSDGYWQYFSPSTRNSSPLTTANPNSYYALVAIIYSGNFRHEVYALERRQFSATLHAVSNSQLSQFYVATFHTNQDRIATSLPESPQQDILALVSQVTVPKGASSSLWLLQPTIGSPRQQLFAGTHLAQILTSGPNLLHETVYAPQGSLKSRTTMGYLLPDHHTLRGFQRLLRSSWPQKLDSLPLSMFTGLRRNDRGLLCHTPDGSGQGFRRTHPNVSYSTVDHESVRFTVNGNSGINPMANASINLSPPNLHNFADSRSALSDVSHVPVPNEFSASFVSNEDISGESSPCLDFPIPFEWNENFVGRRSILRSMKQALKEGPSPRVVLHGIGGIGKTQIALEFASRSEADFTGVFWVQAGGAFNINSQRESTTTEHLVKQLSTDSSPWLLILDNADDISVFGDLWCNHFSGSIIVTTRNKDFDSSLEDTSHTRTSRFEVTPFENEESVKYLRKWAHPAGQAAADDQDLGRLSELLGGLPLAIVLASSYIRHTNKSISQYIDWFVAEVEKPIDLICPEIDPILQSQSISQHNVRYEYNPDPIPETVFTAFRISFEMVRSKDTAATQLLSLLSLYDDMDEVRGGVKNRTGAATELEDQASRFQSCLTYQLRYSFPEQLATFSEQQIKEGLDLLLDLSMVMLHYAATLMIQVPRQSKEVMQLIAQSSKNKMHGVLRPGIGVIA